MLDGLVDGVGYEQRGFPPGEHQGLPSRHVTFVIPFEAPLELSVGPDGRPCRHALDTCVGGLHTTPVTIYHDGTQVGIQLALTPDGARVLFGVPAGELAGTVVDVEELWGALAVELVDRVREAPTWAERFAVLDDVLGRIAAAGRDERCAPPGGGRGVAAADEPTATRACRRSRPGGRLEPSSPQPAVHGRVRDRSEAARPDRAVRAGGGLPQGAPAARRWRRWPPSAAMPTRRTWPATGATSPAARASEWLAAEVLPLVADGRDPAERDERGVDVPT